MSNSNNDVDLFVYYPISLENAGKIIARNEFLKFRDGGLKIKEQLEGLNREIKRYLEFPTPFKGNKLASNENQKLIFREPGKEIEENFRRICKLLSIEYDSSNTSICHEMIEEKVNTIELYN